MLAVTTPLLFATVIEYAAPLVIFLMHPGKEEITSHTVIRGIDPVISPGVKHQGVCVFARISEMLCQRRLNS